MNSTAFQLRNARFLPLFVVFLWITMVPSIAWAQAKAKPQGTPSGANAPPSTTLDPTPFEAESLGLKINFPLGASVSAQKSNGQVEIMVSDDATTPTWTMRIQPLQATSPESTPASQIADLIQQFKSSQQAFQTLTNTVFQTEALEGQLCYIKLAAKPDQSVVSGWLVLPSGKASYMVFAIQTLPEHLPRVRSLLEASFKTIELRSAEDLAADRKARLTVGKQLIDSATPERLKSMVGLKQWFRVYKPSADGATDTEVGYSLMEVLEATKGEVEQTKSTKGRSDGDRQTGIMIRIQSRLIPADRSMSYDSIALYWMAWDQSEEVWSIVGTQRQGEAEYSEAESGVRSYTPGGPPPKLTVVKSVASTNEREPYEWPVPDVYLSQPLGWLIGRLLPKDITQDREYRYYFYNFANRRAQVSQRSDTWGPTNDGTGNFRLITKLTSDSAPITSIYAANGELIRRTHPDGTMTEPSTIETINKLWKSKGLSVGKIKK